MKERLKEISQKAREQILGAESIQAAEALRVEYLGKKGKLTDMLKSMKDLAPEERQAFGQLANETKSQIESLISTRMAELKALAREMQLKAQTIDVTEPGTPVSAGTRHLITQTIDEITRIFMSMGFSVSEGPEVETVFNNFDALNAGPNHPARDMTDTFYITDDVLLRTQTSPVQVRTLLAQKPPIAVIAPGRCFRCDTPDATHSPMFHQVEGLVVDEGITMADLKGVLDSFAKQMFGSSTRTNFRPHHFPFTEPS
ncbi:MAG: phenylalanine--tRNA ligase subunit alpha, partial [Firmicutes bacterium]|nr:phenylalanine--tRNA ligase subunit alpha [Bacillota bacterium]